MNKKDIKIYKEFLGELKSQLPAKKFETFYVDFDRVVRIGDSTDLISVEFVGLKTYDSNMSEEETKRLISNIIQDYIEVHQPIKQPIEKKDFFSYLFLKTSWVFDADEVNICKVNLAERDKDNDKRGNGNDRPPPPTNSELIRINFFEKNKKEERDNLPPLEI